MALKSPPGSAGESVVAGGCGHWRGFFVWLAFASRSAFSQAAMSAGYRATRSGGQSLICFFQRASRTDASEVEFLAASLIQDSIGVPPQGLSMMPTGTPRARWTSRAKK